MILSFIRICMRVCFIWWERVRMSAIHPHNNKSQDSWEPSGQLLFFSINIRQFHDVCDTQTSSFNSQIIHTPTAAAACSLKWRKKYHNRRVIIRNNGCRLYDMADNNSSNLMSIIRESIYSCVIEMHIKRELYTTLPMAKRSLKENVL